MPSPVPMANVTGPTPPVAVKATALDRFARTAAGVMASAQVESSNPIRPHAATSAIPHTRRI